MIAHHTFRARAAIAALVAVFVITLPWTVSAQGVVVTITEPASGASVRGTTTVSASTSGLGSLTVMGVQFKLDGANLGAEDTVSPFTIPWNTTQSSNGPHTLTAVARLLIGGPTTSGPVAVTVDNLPPAVTINQAAGQTDPTNASPVNFTVVFSESITGFAAADVVLSGTAGGTRTVVITGGPSTFNVAVSGVTNGTVIASIAGGAAQDAAGNGSLASTSTDNTVTFDATPPSVTINQAAAQTDPTNASPITFTVAFSEPITGFAAADVAISGTAGGNTTVGVTGGPSTFNVAVSGMTNGTVTATIAGGAAQDAAGNSSLASTSTDNTVTFSATPPAPPSTPDLTAVSDSGVSNVDNITRTTAPTFAGTAEAGSTVKIFSDGIQVGSGVAADGTYSVITSPLSDGPHSITATATNGLNVASSPSAPLSVTIDTASPAVAVTAPAGGATVSGLVTVTAGASDGIGVVGLQFQLNAVSLGAEITSAPYSIAWDTAAVANGSHTLTATARDAAGNTAASAPVAVTVANNAVVRVQDTSGTIAFTPTGTWMQGYTGAFAWSGGTAALGFVAGQRATFSFNGTGISWISFRGPQAGIATVHLDGALVATVDSYTPELSMETVNFSVSSLALGTHTLVIEVTRTKNDASSDYYVVVDAFDVTGGTASPDTTPPLVTIAAPTHQSTVVGTTSIQATASDNVHVAGVRFFVDGAEIGDDTAAPYAVTWNSTPYPDGPHTLTAVARDDAGNSTTSPSVTVNVLNTTPPPAATATRFESHDPAIVYTDGTPAAGRPHRWWHGSRSRSWSGDISSFNRSAGARATFRFNGTSVRWIGFRSFWAGIARVSIDGGPFTDIDLFIPPCTSEQRLQGCRDEEPQTVVFTASGLAPGVEHTMFIESTGTKHGGESCTPSIECSQDYAVVVDAIDVGPALVMPVTGTRNDDTHQAATYTGAWLQNTDPEKAWNGGTAAVSDSAGSSVDLHVYRNDDQLDWLAWTCDRHRPHLPRRRARAGDRHVLAGRSQRHHLHGDQPCDWLAHHSDRGHGNAQRQVDREFGIRRCRRYADAARRSRSVGCLHHARWRDVDAGKRRQGVERRIGKYRDRDGRTFVDGRCESRIRVQRNGRELDRHARAVLRARRRVSRRLVRQPRGSVFSDRAGAGRASVADRSAGQSAHVEDRRRRRQERGVLQHDRYRGCVRCRGHASTTARDALSGNRGRHRVLRRMDRRGAIQLLER